MPRLAANLSWLFQEHDYLARFEAARRVGFCSVECLFPYETPAEQTAAVLKDARLGMVLINTPAGDWEKGERGFAGVPGREAAFRSAFDQAFDYACLIGCTRLHVMAGVVPDGFGIEACEDVFIENLGLAADRLARHRMTATIEPLNSIDVPGYLLNGSAQARRIIEVVGRPNLNLQWDAYHLQIMEGNLLASFERNQDIIGHVQIAGVPGRNEPDRGEINYSFLLARLDALSYQGAVGCEYRPSAGTLAGLGWAKPYGITTEAR
ncbi:MAG: hydroxypyruvate isomerase [Alphaproteobacteria bacterium]|nr:hydroxypyruvate isomerase [Alphaproteobacteria bacterium]